jgi:hypothetical protein
MKIFKNLSCAIIVAAVVIFCAPGARAFNFTTNCDELSITAVIQTNVETIPTPNVDVYAIRGFTLNNAKLLGLLESEDWHNGLFPAGAKLVVGWDAGANVTGGKDGDILVVDKTGVNVLYDASEKSLSHSGGAYMAVDFYDGNTGAYSANENQNNPGHFDFTMYSNTTFGIFDSAGLYLSTTGPSTAVSVQTWDKSHNYLTWSDSQRATAYCAGTNVDFAGILNATATVKITASGHGKGAGGFYYLVYVH